jgi:hypothetical protein
MDLLPPWTWISWLVTVSLHRSLYFELLSRSFLMSPLFWVTRVQIRKDDMLRCLQSLWAFTHTNGCLSLHYSWPSQCISTVLLWHTAGISNPCSSTFFLYTVYSSNLSGVQVAEILVPFMWLLPSRVGWYMVPRYYYMPEKCNSLFNLYKRTFFYQKL